MLNIGILGAGFMGGTHARAFAGLPDVHVAGVTSRSADRAAALAREVGAEPFTDALALVRDPRVDAVSITLPTHLHREYTTAALEAGKHVLLEKPMALSVPDCDAMIEVAQKNGRILMVAHVLRFWPEYTALVGFLQTGQIGKALSATAQRLAGPPRWSDWLLHPELSGGEVLDLHIHDLDTFNWLFGQPRTVYSRGQRSSETNGWDLALTLVDYGAVRAFAEGSALQPLDYPFTMNLCVLCEQGSVEFRSRAGGVQVDSRDAGTNSLLVYEGGGAPYALPVIPGDGYANQAAYFADCVRSGRAPERGTARQARLAVQTALAARESLETGRVIAL